MGPNLTRRQLLGAGLGLASSSLLAAGCSDSPTDSSKGFELLQSVKGPRMTSGRTISARYVKNLTSGSLLVAVVSRMSTGVLAPTIGQVSDDRGNHWKQAVEYFGGDHYGIDIWYCESAHGGSRPTVEGICLAYPVLPGISGIQMVLVEYRGASGYELCDQIGQADIVGTSLTSTTDFALGSDHELAVSVIMGDMESASTPKGWNLRESDPDQRFFIADTLDTGNASAGKRLSATWRELEGATAGTAVLATFVPRGVTQRSRRLVQSSYTDSAILPAGSGHSAWMSQAYPVDPAPGNTLVAFMNGSIYNPSIDCGSIESVTDSAGGTWRKAGQSGVDNHTGINISCWVCDSAVGGPTTLTATFSNASQQLACLLLELANLPPDLKVQDVVRRTFGGDEPHLETGRAVSAGDVAFAFRTSIYVKPQGPGSPAWTQVLSDTTGANALMMLNTSPGRLTASWSGDVVTGGLDFLLVAVTPGHAG